jgi:hypothetical protein
MTVIDREQPTRERPPERAVFVAQNGRRARALRRVAVAAALLACLWVVGLGVGMLGFGSLPGVSVVKGQIGDMVGGSGSDTPGAEQIADIAPASVRRSSRDRASDVAAAATRVVESQSRARTRPAASRPRPPLQATAPPPASQAVNPAQRTRGWARTGQTAPPGQARKATPPPPPGTGGQRRGQDPTEPPPVPPGQEKKALLPPPPTPPTKA